MRIFDLHSDILTTEKPKKVHKSISRSVGEGLGGLVSAVYSTGKSEAQVFSLVDRFVAEKRQFEAEGNALDLCLSFEDLGFVNACNLDKVLMACPKMCSLSWNMDNRMAGGTYGSNGLSAFGAKTVDILESAGIFVDTAHLNERSFMDVARIAKRPLVCSHTAFFGACEHPRNLRDYQVRIVLESGGIVGLSLVSYFLSPAKKVTSDDFVRHILYFVNTFGSVEGICVGTDFFGTKHLPKDLETYAMFELVANKLVDLGFSDDDIDKIFFSNAAKFLHS